MKNARWLDVQRHERLRLRDQENSARQASCWLTYTVFGNGEVLVAQPERFHTPFFGEPAVSFGFHLAVAPDLDAYLLPRVTGGVYRWVVEGRDRYVGMYPFFTVDIDPRPGGTESVMPLDAVEVVAHLSFTGLSYKSMGETVPSKLVDAAIPAREVPFTP